MSKDRKQLTKNCNIGNGVSTEKLTYPAILLLIAQIDSHGYDIIQRLNHLDYMEGEIETSTVYRILRRMEQDGVIISHWEDGEFGPARRKYKITPLGLDLLDEWALVLKLRSQQIESFLNSFNEIYKNKK